MNYARTLRTERLQQTGQDLLGWLLAMPLLSPGELAALAGWPQATVYWALGRLERQGLVASLRASTAGTAPARRFYLAPAGILAAARARGVSTDFLLRRYPVSAHWLRLLLARLDAVASIYRLVLLLSEAAEIRAFRWYRKLPLDATTEVEGGRTLGVLREGPVAPPAHLGRRLRALLHGPHPNTIFVLAPDPLRLRHWKRVLARFPFLSFIAVETDLPRSGPDAALWHMASDPDPWPLAPVIPLVAGGDTPVERPLRQVAMPPHHLQPEANRLASGGCKGSSHDYLLPAVLRAGEKQVLELLALWPWLALRDLGVILGASPPAVLDQLSLPLRLGLVGRVHLGGRLRYVVSDRGLRFLARRDRLAVPSTLRRWSPSPLDPEAPYTWRNSLGTRTRHLARDIAHTAAVHRFLAAMATQARFVGHEVVHLQPSHRAVRRCQSNGRYLTLNPDAYGEYVAGGTPFPFFLEWERRAAHPAHFHRKLTPYLEYYATRRPLEDYGAYPVLLVVLRDEVAESHFLRVARQAVARAGITTLRVLASHADLVKARGPLGPVWSEGAGTTRKPPW